MKTESKKFKRNIVISHHNNCGDPNCTTPDTPGYFIAGGGNENAQATGETTNSGKFDWNQFASGAMTDITNMLGGIFGKQPVTYVTNNTKDDEGSNTALYVGLGAGALVLIVLLVVLLKK